MNKCYNGVVIWWR